MKSLAPGLPVHGPYAAWREHRRHLTIGTSGHGYLAKMDPFVKPIQSKVNWDSLCRAVRLGVCATEKPSVAEQHADGSAEARKSRIAVFSSDSPSE